MMVGIKFYLLLSATALFIVTEKCKLLAAPRINLALHKSVIADSYNGARYPSLAVDSIKTGSSRWENDWLDGRPDSLKGNAWIYVDLGRKFLVDSVAIYWEHSGSGRYKIQVWESEVVPPSSNDTGWTTLITDTSLTYNDPLQMCLSLFKLPSKQTRYVRCRSYKRLWNPGWGVSIEEFEVYGNPITGVTPKQTVSTGPAALQIITTGTGARIKTGAASSDLIAGEIISIDGRLIRTIRGTGELFWDFTDESGVNARNGIYGVTVRTGKGIAYGKFTVSR
jgi:hypothetical protein